MPLIKMIIEETIEVPEGSQLVLAPTGVLSGIRLPDGHFIKPFGTYELYTNEDEDPIVDNATYKQLFELGVEQGDTFRTAEVIEGDVETDESEVA